ncbi:hypothetical protein [Castellaniella sp.]|uniref:hypothetical protein n=1 Tax=Castellaniella sp. TaxID=1955812 RepID=UPI002AFE230B|nr:hypothetical protein [Castellaniella sp.]
MTDKYAKLRKDVPQAIEEAKAEGGINHRAQMIADLLADYDRMREALTQAKKWISRDEHGDECRGEGIFCCCGKYDLEKAIAAALAQEGS